MNTKKTGRESDEQDSTTSVWWNYINALLITGGLIAIDIFTDKGLIDGALIGMIVMKAWDGITKQNDYFFPSRRQPSENGGKNGQTQNR